MEPLGRHAPARLRRAEPPVHELQLGVGAGPQRHEPAPDQVLDVAHRQAQADRVAVADAGQLPLTDAGHLLQALLQRGDDQHRALPRPLAQELEEPEVLRQRRPALGAQELAQLVHHQQQAGAAGGADGVQQLGPGGGPVAAQRRRLAVQRPPRAAPRDVLQVGLSPVLDQRHGDRQRRAGAQRQLARAPVPARQRPAPRRVGQQLGQRGQEMRLARAEVADQQEPGAVRPLRGLQHGGQAPRHVAGQDQVVQPAGRAVEAHDGLGPGDRDEIGDPGRHHSGSLPSSPSLRSSP